MHTINDNGTQRPMTENEETLHAEFVTAWQNEQAAASQAAAQHAALRQTAINKLEALGLTHTEIAALVGA